MKKKKDESFLDRTARKLEQTAEKIAEGQRGAAAFTEIAFAADRTTGDYPQAAATGGKENFENDGGHYHDRFPKPRREPLQYSLKKKAKWTDVMSSSPFAQGYLLNSKALAEFERFELGNVKQYLATVRDSRGANREYSYLFVGNHVDLKNIDFASSQFYVADMVSKPMFPIEVASADDYWRLTEEANNAQIEGSERFSKIMFQKLVFSPRRAPKAAIFGMGRLSTKMYVSSQLGDAIIMAGISGLELRPNTRLFVSDS